MTLADAAGTPALGAMTLTFAVCQVLLFFKCHVVALYAIDKSARPEEDFDKSKIAVDLPAVPDDIKRRLRAVMNDLENIPIDVSTFWAAFVVVVAQAIGGRSDGGAGGAGQAEALALTVLFPLYTAFRFWHSYSYLRAMQPHRTLAMLLGLFTTIAASGVLLSSASKQLA